jgi:hypothetical protein
MFTNKDQKLICSVYYFFLLSCYLYSSDVWSIPQHDYVIQCPTTATVVKHTFNIQSIDTICGVLMVNGRPA